MNQWTISPERRKFLARLEHWPWLHRGGFGWRACCRVSAWAAVRVGRPKMAGRRTRPTHSRTAKLSKSNLRMPRRWPGRVSRVRPGHGFAVKRMASSSLSRSTAHIWDVRCDGFSRPSCSCVPATEACITKTAPWPRGRRREPLTRYPVRVNQGQVEILTTPDPYRLRRYAIPSKSLGMVRCADRRIEGDRTHSEASGAAAHGMDVCVRQRNAVRFSDPGFHRHCTGDRLCFKRRSGV